MAQGTWKATKITAPSNMTTADKVKEWIDSFQITATQAMIVRDDWTTLATGNGTLIVANIYIMEILKYIFGITIITLVVEYRGETRMT